MTRARSGPAAYSIAIRRLVLSHPTGPDLGQRIATALARAIGPDGRRDSSALGRRVAEGVSLHLARSRIGVVRGRAANGDC